MNTQNLTRLGNSCSYSSHAYLELYHMSLNFHRTWNNQKELYSSTLNNREARKNAQQNWLCEEDHYLDNNATNRRSEQYYRYLYYEHYLSLERYKRFCTTYITDTHFLNLCLFFKTINRRTKTKSNTCFHYSAPL